METDSFEQIAGPPLAPVAPVGAASIAPTPTSKFKPVGEALKDCATCPELVVVPAGEFMMGSAATEEGREGSEGPRHLVKFARPFAIGKAEVTFEQYDACVAAKACVAAADAPGGRGRRPAVNVNYKNARRYVAWLTKTTGHNYYLPTEAEWEYAARGGTDTPWWTGDAVVTDDANILNAHEGSVPVAAFPPNGYGLHDTIGNVEELVQDCFDTGYFGAPADGGAVTGAATCKHVARGGGWSSEPARARSAARRAVEDKPAVSVGFRVTRALD